MSTLEFRERQKDVWQIARAQNNLAVTYLYLGSHESAMELFTAALAGFREVGDRREESNVLNNLSDLFLALDDRVSARQFLERSLDITRDLGSEWDYAVTQVNLANILNSAEASETVLNLHREAAFTFRRLGDRRNETVAVNGMGEVLQSIGQYGEAIAHHQSAHALAVRIGAAHEVAQSLRLLGTAELHLGQLDAASSTLGAALALAQAIHAAGEEDLARSALARLREVAGEGSGVCQVGIEHDQL
jgi:tetratricopeptide (TPR) repeat protein